MATTTATSNNNNSTIITNEGRKPLVKDLHEHIVCPLCRGYLIDATTLVECLHSFCRGCIVRRLGSGARACPVCGALTLPPLLPDLALQRLVYMAVPGLYRSELERRRHFRLVNPQCPPPAPPLGGLSLTMEDPVSLSLCEILNDDHDRDDGGKNFGDKEDVDSKSTKNQNQNQNQNNNNNNNNQQLSPRNRQEDRDNSSSNKRLIRYLKCPAGVTVRHLVRLLALKRGWGDTEGKFTLKNIEMLYQNGASDGEERVGSAAIKNSRLHRLQLSWTLLDLACIFKWDKETPMKLFYRVVKREEPLLQPPSITTSNVIGISNNNNNNNSNSNNSIVTGNSTNGGMENVQRPPTPPPSPKQSSNNSDIRTQPLQHQLKPKSKSSTENAKIESSLNNPTESRVKETPSVPISDSEKLREIKDPEKFQSSNLNPNCNSSSVSSSVPKPSDPMKNCPPEISTVENARAANPERSENHGVKVKKPRCEVTPVMRAPGLHGSCAPAVGTTAVDGSNRSGGKVPRLEHHKRRKRRNKRLIAEITTTPREDLLKLKVRLTPCPPRITSSTAGSAKEKLLQMRAVRREKIKNNNDRGHTTATTATTPTPTPTTTPTPTPPPPPVVVVTSAKSPEMPLTPPPSASAEVITAMPIIAPKNELDANNSTSKTSKGKEITGDVREETIEDIIDGIPDEVVRVAQILNSPGTLSADLTSGARDKDKELIDVKNCGALGGKKKKRVRIPEVHIISDEDDELEEEIIEELDESSSTSRTEVKLTLAKPKKDEEVLRRLGLVAISEASKTLQDKIRSSQKSGGSGNAGVGYNRESLERQLRESKANRVRSLLAEKQMRDALKSIMSKSKGSGPKAGGPSGPKKGPPPLAPLTPKQGFPSPPKSSHPTASHPQIVNSRTSGSGGGKIEKPLDLSSGANNALDLSPATPSSSVNPPVITSTTFPSPVVVKSRSKTAGEKIKPSNEEKKNQDNLNLRTLSDAAVSLLGTGNANCCQGPVGTGGEVRIANSTILSNKVALRIPQYHNRIGGFGNGMKIKPNLAVRHIPNPQAFVASQYVRNQRTSFFNAQQQQPP